MQVTFTDILIIGGGVIGNSIAYHLARQGRQVLVIERSQIADLPAASWASAGGVRRQGRHPAEAKLAIEAIQRWKTLEQELEADLGYRQGGNLLLAESDNEADFLSKFVEQQHKMGFTDVRFVDRKEALSLVQGLNERVVAGSYSSEDGQADPVLTTRAFSKAAQRYKASYWTGVYTSSLLMQNTQIIGARTERCDIRAEHVILAAGAWSDELAITIGVHLPIRTRALQMILSTPIHNFQLEPVPGLSGFTLAVGFSGHGFALAPAIGRCVAGQINGLSTPELDELNPSRIASFTPESIESFNFEESGGDFLE